MAAKNLLIFSFAFILTCSWTQAQEIAVATFNIRYANQNDIGNLWKDRAPIVSNLIRFHDFDVFGTQEGLLNQLEDISSALPQYTRYGIGREDGKEKGEFSAIFYKKAVFTLLDKGDFWLSETPDKPSLGWDATCCNRICSWVYLQHKPTGKKFYFFNTHFDHQGMVARKESSKLILQKIKNIAGNNPAILTGDLNGDHDSEWYNTLANSGLLKDAYQSVKNPYANNGSFNGFGATIDQKKIIDHVFVSKQFNIRKWGILTDTYHGKYPSDHFPIVAFIEFK
jgi:endonuclease/exonuclease/phosphatase family metal-dependent hydrolase